MHTIFLLALLLSDDLTFEYTAIKHPHGIPQRRWGWGLCLQRLQWEQLPVTSSPAAPHLLVCFSVTQSCLTLCDPIGWSTPGFPVLHHLLELAQTHVHLDGDAIQPSHLILCHPLLSCLQSFPASGSFLMSQLFASGGQTIGASASASVPPMNIQNLFPLGWTGLISLKSKGLSRVFSSTTVAESINSSALSLFYCPALTLVHDYWKNHSFDYMDLCRQSNIFCFFFFLVGKTVSLLFKMLSRFVIVFLPKSKSLLISWLQSPSTVILEPKKIKSLFPLFPHLFAMKWWDWMSWSSFFERGHLKRELTSLSYFIM